MEYQLNRTTRQFINRIWGRSPFDEDPRVVITHVSEEGQLVNFDDDIRPDTSSELWATFDQNNFRKSNVADEDLRPIFEISTKGKLTGKIGSHFEPETVKELHFAQHRVDWRSQRFRFREDWT